MGKGLIKSDFRKGQGDPLLPPCPALNVCRPEGQKLRTERYWGAGFFVHPVSLGRDASHTSERIIPLSRKLASPALFLQKTQCFIYGQRHFSTGPVALMHCLSSHFPQDRSNEDEGLGMAFPASGEAMRHLAISHYFIYCSEFTKIHTRLARYAGPRAFSFAPREGAE
jgi:hypothetical protein